MKKRLLFTTFWLWAIIIANAYLALMNFINVSLIDTNSDISVEDYRSITWLILGLVNIVAAALILNWKKFGFWLIVVTSVASLLGGQHAFIISMIGLIVLVAVLQIKLDGVSCWEQLGKNNFNASTPETNRE